MYVVGSILIGIVDCFDIWQLILKGDLMGVYIIFDKNVGVIFGNKKIKIGLGGFFDYLCEMMILVGWWGKNFIFVFILDRIVGDIFRFIVSEVSIIVIIIGGYIEIFIMVNVGDMVEKEIVFGVYCFIKLDKVVMVVQLVFSQQFSVELFDFVMMVFLFIEQFVVDYIFIMFKYLFFFVIYISYFMFVIKDFDKDGFKIGGIFFFIIYNIVMYNGVDYVVGYIYVFEGIYIVCYDLLIKVFGGYFYGRVNYEIYVFMIGI